MDEARAQHLVDRRNQLTKEIGHLLDEYTECLRAGGIESSWWADAQKALSADDQSRSDATIQLANFDETLYDDHVVTGWALGVELGQAFPPDPEHSIGITRGYLCPIHQSPSMTVGIHYGAI